MQISDESSLKLASSPGSFISHVKYNKITELLGLLGGKISKLKKEMILITVLLLSFGGCLF